MRKFLLLLAFAGIFGLQNSTAQNCIPSPFFVALGIPGVYPNPIQTPDLSSGTQNSPYSEALTIIVVPDTTVDLSVFFPGLPTVNVAVAYHRVTGLNGLPAGLSYTCLPNNCEVPGDSAGCVSISGTPTQAGEFTVDLISEIGIEIPMGTPVIGGTTQNLPVPGQSWTMKIDSNMVSTIKPNENGFGGVKNAPNPFEGVTTITYDAPKAAAVEFAVMDLSGRRLHTESFRAQAGVNTLDFDAAGYAPGIYFYSLSDGTSSVVKKMVIAE